MDDLLKLARGGRIETDGDLAKLLLAMSNPISNTLKSTGTRSPARIETGTGTITSQAREPIISLRGNGVGFDLRDAHELCGHPQGQEGSGRKPRAQDR
jgi:hypothetical protein